MDYIDSEYSKFIEKKSQCGINSGFEPKWIPDFLFDFQKYITSWMIKKGRGAGFEDCGLGKTLQQLVYAKNIYLHTGKPVLIFTPLAVAQQTVREAEKFNIEAVQSKNGKVAGEITVTNYEKIHLFDPNDYSGVVCDESSILKHYTGHTQKVVTRFMSKIPYRSLWTATAAPNDWPELGTSSEAIGELSHTDMLKMFFKYCDDKAQKKDLRLQDEAIKGHNYYKKLSFRVSQTIGQWRLKSHAVTPFWRWVSSWVRACRMPSDLGFSDDGFILPELIENIHTIEPEQPPDGMLFYVPAYGLGEEREERRYTLKERCEKVAETVEGKDFSAIWCHLNPEGDFLEKIIPDSKQISGRTSEDEKEEIYNAFSSGQLKRIITKPKIGAWGLNWQHCAHVVKFASHSFEQDYQSVRRCWRFGQKRKVVVDTIASKGEERVIANMKRKALQSETMFKMLVSEMNNSEKIIVEDKYTKEVEVPSWL